MAWGQAQKRTRTAEVSADDMVFKWETNQFEFTGNCVLEVSGPNQATIAAPRMSVQLTADGRSIKFLKATGPLRTTVVTAPDSQGVKRRIVATAAQYATYVEADQVVEMVGDAQADIITLPEKPDSPKAHFSGDVLRLSLKSGELSAKRVRIRMEGEFGAPEQGERQ
jgi:lipopolysaccharide export system protein LptA